jgi:2-polyprenyl-3-methyl-5-hydroxy-6-metoxy-1,4-benzoquinol methylase
MVLSSRTLRAAYGPSFRLLAGRRGRSAAAANLVLEAWADRCRRSRPFPCDPSPSEPPPFCSHQSTIVMRRFPREIVRCRRCQVAFATTRDTVERAREVHDQGYFEANRDFIYPDGSPNYFEYAMPRTLFFWALGFSQFAPKGQRALDVGCGNGLMLRYLRFLGYEPSGGEISEWAADYARTVVGEERVTTGTLHEVGYPDGHFRLVTLVHVLEHLDEPAPLLAEVRRVLEPGGLLYVEVPSSERDVTRYLLTCAGFRDVPIGEGWGKRELHSVPFIFALAHTPG